MLCSQVQVNIHYAIINHAHRTIGLKADSLEVEPPDFISDYIEHLNGSIQTPAPSCGLSINNSFMQSKVHAFQFSPPSHNLRRRYTSDSYILLSCQTVTSAEQTHTTLSANRTARQPSVARIIVCTLCARVRVRGAAAMGWGEFVDLHPPAHAVRVRVRHADSRRVCDTFHPCRARHGGDFQVIVKWFRRNANFFNIFHFEPR